MDHRNNELTTRDEKLNNFLPIPVDVCVMHLFRHLDLASELVYRYTIWRDTSFVKRDSKFAKPVFDDLPPFRPPDNMREFRFRRSPLEKYMDPSGVRGPIVIAAVSYTPEFTKFFIEMGVVTEHFAKVIATKSCKLAIAESLGPIDVTILFGGAINNYRLDLLEQYNDLATKDINWISLAVSFGQKESIRWLHSRGHQITATVLQSTVRTASSDILSLVFTLGGEPDINLYRVALYGNHDRIERFKLLREHQCPWDESIAALVAREGKVDLLEWITNNGCPMDETVTLEAAKVGRIEVLEWWKNKGLEISENVSTVGAGNQEVHVWLRANDAPINHKVCLGIVIEAENWEMAKIYLDDIRLNLAEVADLKNMIGNELKDSLLVKLRQTLEGMVRLTGDDAISLAGLLDWDEDGILERRLIIELERGMDLTNEQRARLISCLSPEYYGLILPQMGEIFVVDVIS